MHLAMSYSEIIKVIDIRQSTTEVSDDFIIRNKSNIFHTLPALSPTLFIDAGSHLIIVYWSNQIY
jgi:hypothetical protein